MKNKINLLIALATLVVVSVSCSDNFLEEKKQYGNDDDSFYESADKVEWYVNNMYYDYFQAYNSPLKSVVGLYNDSRTRLTEEVGGMQNLINPTLSYVNASDGDAYYGTRIEDKMINNPYSRIRECNAFLEKIDVIGANLDEAFRKKFKGQVYYLRAIQYFDLMRVYGGVPIVTNTQDSDIDDVTIKLPRAKVSEVVAQIVADLDIASTLLPDKWDAANYGRFTRGAALAQKARVLLTYASPLFNKSWDSSTERWDAALAAGLAAETQLTADGFGLFGNTAKQWQEMFLVDNSFCKEAIVVQLLSSANTGAAVNSGWEGSLRLISQGGRGGMEAPKEMIDLFPMANGSRPTAANNYNEFLFFKNRDPRFYRTFAFSGSYWPYTTSSSTTTVQPTVWAYRWLDTKDKAYFSDANNNEKSPAFVRKMSNPTANSASSFQYSGTDIFEYRYAELLLNIAECYAAKGDIPNTLAYLTQIRKRVGISSANNYGIGTLTDKYAAIEACLYERRVELAYEGKRYWDVQRWMLYSDDSSINQDNTNVKLGIPTINGTQRTGNFLQYKTKTASSADPLASARAGISVNPDASDFQTQIAALEAFYTNNFVIEKLPDADALDVVSQKPAKIDFKPNYYIMGLKQDVLALNPWMIQTVGWNGVSASGGTFIYQE